MTICLQSEMCDYLFATVTLYAMCDCLQSEMCDYLFATVTICLQLRLSVCSQQ